MTNGQALARSIIDTSTGQRAGCTDIEINEINEPKRRDPQIAATILQQLGGTGRLVVMIGAKRFLDVGDGVHFSIGRNCKRVNLIEIKLSSLDLYDIRFLNFSIRRDPAKMVKTISESSGVYFDQLRSVIEHGTGMAAAESRSRLRARSAGRPHGAVLGAHLCHQSSRDEPGGKGTTPMEHDYVIFVNDKREIDFRVGGQALPAGSTPIVAVDGAGGRAVLHGFLDVEFSGDKPTLDGPPEYRAKRWRVADFEAAVQEEMGLVPVVSMGPLAIKMKIAKLEGQLATIAGEPLLIWDGTSGDHCEPPPGGALLTVEWAVEDQSYTEWYPTTEAAQAALAALARSKGTTDDGWYADLTSPGCHSSSAVVTRRSASQWAEDQRCKDLDEEDGKAQRLAEETERENDLWDSRDGAHD